MYRPGSGETRYDTRGYCNVRSKADISQLNLPPAHGSSTVAKSRPIYVRPRWWPAMAKLQAASVPIA